jgi:predicted transposase YbfD/YdcC
MAIPLLDAIDIEGKVITADALLTQRAFADYLVRTRKAHYHFTVKGNQPTLLADIELFFHNRQEPDYTDDVSADHGRIETRKIWATTDLNDYLNFPHVAQAFVIERHCMDKRTGKHSCETAYGITSQSPQEADARSIAAITSSIGTTMKIGAEYAKASVRKTSHDCADSPLE